MMLLLFDGWGEDAVGRIAGGAFENHRAMKDLRIAARLKARNDGSLGLGNAQCPTDGGSRTG